MAKEESDLSTCRLCEQIKLRRFVGKFDDKNKKYVDDQGKLWNGRVCPQCHSDRSRSNMKRLRMYGKTRNQFEIRDAGESGSST
jgi:hypothetical protein